MIEESKWFLEVSKLSGNFYLISLSFYTIPLRVCVVSKKNCKKKQNKIIALSLTVHKISDKKRRKIL